MKDFQKVKAKIIFDGREFARRREARLLKDIKKLKKRGKIPRLVSILVGRNSASKLYVLLKKRAAERIGCILDIEKFDADTPSSKIIQLIEKLNSDPFIDGIMLQMPLPRTLERQKVRIINTILPQKDVDGLRSNSPFMAAAAKAVIYAIGEAKKKLQIKEFKKTVVVGAYGMVGSQLTRQLRLLGYKIVGCDRQTKDLAAKTRRADLLISATGKPNLIKSSMVKEGAVIIDVGSPKGDVLFSDVLPKVSFITPVPGGIGPVTIVSLLENLVLAASQN